MSLRYLLLAWGFLAFILMTCTIAAGLVGGVVLTGGIRQEAFFYRQANILEELEMTTTIIGIIVTALAIELDKFTQYKHYALPLIALAGVLTVIASLVL